MTADASLVVIEAAIAESVRRSGGWIACRRGCTPCCHGRIDITASDVERLLEGLEALRASSPARAEAILARAAAAGEGDDDPCPVLDPATGACELYAWRPVICRSFGPALRYGEMISVCELCYSGAPDIEIAACAVDLDPALAGEDVTTVVAALR